MSLISLPETLFDTAMSQFEVIWDDEILEITGRMKEKLFKALIKRFKEERKRYQELKDNPDKVKKILEDGSGKARKQAVKKMMEVRDKIGVANKYSFYKYD